MSDIKMKPARNRSMDCCKLVASFFVVFIHVQFPDKLGVLITGIARFAVPLFFAISGYFNYNSSCQKIKLRFRHILLLNFAGLGIQLFWPYASAVLYESSFPKPLDVLYLEPRDNMQWLILNINPYGAHLWYLSALLVCYVVLWLYVRFFGEEKINYKPLYIVSFVCMLLNLIHGEFALVFGMPSHYELIRNALFLGIPMFTFGIFLREYHDRIMSSYNLTTGKLVVLVLLGSVISIGESLCFGACDITTGALLIAFALMLLMIKHPCYIHWCVAEAVVSRFGAYSTLIYLVHMVVKEYYMGLQQYGLYLQYGDAEAMMRPLIILGESLLIAVVVDSIVCVVTWLWKKTKTGLLIK
ncbi:MAG: acyltransferase [Oscillospiraceae bacterium]